MRPTLHPPPAVAAADLHSVRIPVVLTDPLRIKGLYARGDYRLPLATTDGGVPSSCQIGIGVIAASGGCTAMLIDEAIAWVLTVPFRTLQQAGMFAHWVVSARDTLRGQAASATDQTLVDLRAFVEGSRVRLFLEFAAGDEVAGGPVTAAVTVIHAHLREYTPIHPEGDLPPFVPWPPGGGPGPVAHGRRACAEVTVPREVTVRSLGQPPERAVARHRLTRLPTAAGPPPPRLGALAALFVATGQDLGAAAAAATGPAHVEITARGDLHAAITLPGLAVGTVGGATSLPTQKAALEQLGLAGTGKSRALAEVCAALGLAADLGGLAARL